MEKNGISTLMWRRFLGVLTRSAEKQSIDWCLAVKVVSRAAVNRVRCTS